MPEEAYSEIKGLLREKPFHLKKEQKCTIRIKWRKVECQSWEEAEKEWAVKMLSTW